jgi:hypothetical protein
MGISGPGSVPQISNPTSTGDYSSSGTGSIMLTSPFTGLHEMIMYAQYNEVRNMILGGCITRLRT